MKVKNLGKKISDLTLGTFVTISDLILFLLAISIEMGLHPADARSIAKTQKRIGQLYLKGADRIISNAIYQARHKGWVDKNLNLTEEGYKRLKSALPLLLPERNWDGMWYLAIFDIPEKMKIKRDILRENLKALGFGQLQASVLISAINYLEVAEEIVKNYQLEPYVIFAQTNKIGKESSQELANKVWKLKELNEEYRELLEEWEKADNSERFWLKFRYFSILRRDPQLPKELLPENWLGLKAHKIFGKFLKFFNKSL